MMVIIIPEPLFPLRQMQALKRMEHALTMATEQLDFTRSVYDELQAKVTKSAPEQIHTLTVNCIMVSWYVFCAVQHFQRKRRVASYSDR